MTAILQREKANVFVSNSVHKIVKTVSGGNGEEERWGVNGIGESVQMLYMKSSSRCPSFAVYNALRVQCLFVFSSRRDIFRSLES